ncbi:MAG: hypothetical protein ACYCSF_11835 [Acidimicrobiales bacterium]
MEFDDTPIAMQSLTEGQEIESTPPNALGIDSADHVAPESAVVIMVAAPAPVPDPEPPAKQLVAEEHDTVFRKPTLEGIEVAAAHVVPPSVLETM